MIPSYALLELALLEVPAELDASVPNPTQSLLEDSLGRKTYLFLGEPWSRSLASRVAVYFSNDGYRSGPGATLPDGSPLEHQLFRARLADGGVYNFQAQVMNGLDLSDGLPSFGIVKVIRADDDPEVMELLDYEWSDAPLRMYLGRPDWTLSNFALIGRGAAAGIQADAMAIPVVWRDLSRRLGRDIQQTTYRGMGAAVYFDGVDDYIDCGSSSTFNFTSGAFTVEFWVYGIGTATANLVSRGLGNTDGWTIRLNSSRQIEFRTHQASATQMTTSNALTLKRWTHVACVRSGASVLIYVDGVLSVASSATHVNPATASRNLLFGISNGATAPFNGVLDEVRIFNVARSAEQITANKDRELTTLTNCVGLWHFSEGTTTSTADSSGTGATGTLTSGALWVGSLSGGPGLAGRCVPQVYGRHLEWEAFCVDEKFGVWQWHDSSVQEATTIKHKGATGYTIEASSGNVADPYDLYLNPPGSGKYRTCTSAGLVRFGGTLPDGKVTITGKGDNGGGAGYVEDAAGVAKLIAKRLGIADPSEFDLAAFAKTSGDFPQPVWIGSGLDRRSGDSMIVEVLKSIQGWRTVTREGLLSVGVLAQPTTAKFVLGLNDVAQDRIGLTAESVPSQQTVLGYAPYGTTLGPSDLAIGVAGDTRTDLGEEFRYAETTTDATVLQGNSNAPVRKRATRLVLAADAAARAAVEQSYWSVKRRAITVPLTEGLHQYAIGDAVELDFPVDTPLLMLDAGWKGQIVGFVEDVPQNISLSLVG